MGLRPYQQEFLASVRADYDSGIRRLLGVLPTGGGKTQCFARIPETLGLSRGEKTMVLVHRNELVYQAAEKMAAANPRMRVGIERAGERACEVDDDIVVASVQSIGKCKRLEDGTYEYGARLARFDPDQFKAIIVDEVHHAAGQGESYASALRFMGVHKPEPQHNTSDKLLLGVTATPNRSDSIGLENILDKITYQKDIRSMIADGWLCDISAYRIATEVDISRVGTARGDFAIGELERTVNTPRRNNLIVDKYIEHGQDLPFFGFAVDVQHAVDLAKAFSDRGIPARMVCGKTPPKERAALFQSFRDGHIKGLLSAGVLSEGIDIPSVCVGIMARPTQSQLLYCQQVGRVLRPFPAPEELAEYARCGTVPPWIKPFAIVLDFCDLSGRHQLNTVPTLFGLRHDFDMKGKAAAETIAEVERMVAQQRLPIDASSCKSLDELKAVCERVDLFAKPRITDEIRRHSQFAWVTAPSGGYQICLPDYTTLRITQDTLGGWTCYRSVKGAQSMVFRETDLAPAIGRADFLIPADAKTLLKQSASWRSDAATEKQAMLIYKFCPGMRAGMNRNEFAEFFTQNYTKGDASSMITNATAGGSRRA